MMREHSQSPIDDGDEDDSVRGISLTPVVTALFKPAATYLGEELRELIRTPIENWKARRREYNLRDHVARVKARIAPANTDETSQFEILTVRGADFVADWTETVQDIDPNDSELSAIWESLMARFLKGEEVSTELFNALKSLSPGEAAFLLRLNERNHLWLLGEPLLLSLPRPLRNKTDLFFARALFTRNIVTKSYLPLLVYFGVFSLAAYALAWSSTQSMANAWTWSSALAIVVTGLTYMVFGDRLVGWSLTWLGEELVRVADQTEGAPKSTTTSQETKSKLGSK